MAIAKSFGEPLRLWRSPASAGGDECYPSETRTANAAYTDAVLADIAAQGFNAVWLHGELRVMAPSRVFPELAPEAGVHLRAMRELIARAGRHGLRVFVYLQPPRGLPVDDPFWQAHPEVGGVVTRDLSGVDIRAFCTSHAAVKRYLRDSSARIFEELPGLGGVILITASEFPAHCYSKVNFREDGHTTCPRCAGRDPVDVASEIVRLVRDGVRSVSASAEIIVWNWSWRMYEANPNPRIIAGLPGDVILMADFERGGRRKILGRMRPVDEYSLGYVGPSPTFRRAVELARGRGLRTMAKLQIGTTHELATVPNLPLIGNLHDKVKALKKLGIDSFLGCWSFGCEPSANTVAFNRFWNVRHLPPREAALREFAADYFPGCRANRVTAAWNQFARAMKHYPFCISFLYFGPVNYAMGLPVAPTQAAETPLGPSWVDVERGEWIECKWLDHFEWPEIPAALEQIAAEWGKGVEQIEAGLRNCESTHARQELDNARIVGHSFRSAWNMYRFFALRKNWRDACRPEYARIARDEIANLEAALPILDRDPRFGWHGECHAYLYNAASVRRKCETLHAQTGSD